MIFLAKLGIGVLGTALVGAAAVSSEGFIHVRVHEKQPNGTNVNLLVPAALPLQPWNSFPPAISTMALTNCASVSRSLTLPYLLFATLPMASSSKLRTLTSMCVSQRPEDH
jgi:hypothetical protein